jgi:ABC-2 type transport system ATP-binding protein
MAILAVNHLTKRFGEFTAVGGISFALEPGQILGFLGPNGAGKTTTIQMLLGVMTPTAGDIVYFGKPFAKHRSDVLEHIGFSSSYTNLPWDLTVGECLRYTSYLYRIRDRSTRVAEIAELFDLGDLLRRQVKQLSEGEKTRVNLAKAFLHRPKILLLDEPTASLDPDVAAYVRRFLVAQREQHGVSVLLTSHNMTEVEEICDRVIILNKARVIIDDTPRQVTRSFRKHRVKLVAAHSAEAVAEVCRRRELALRRDATSVTIDVAHDRIAELLHELAAAAVTYTDIAIDEPSLEEVFVDLVHHA